MIELIYFERKLVMKKILIGEDEVLLKQLKKSRRNFWLELTSPSMDELAFLGKIFHLHSLVIEDIFKVETKPKFEDYRNYDFFVLHGVHTKNNSMVGVHEMEFVLGKNFLISSHNTIIETFVNFKKNPDVIARHIQKGIDFLFHHLLDMEIDNFFPVLDELDAKIDAISDKVIREPKPIHLDALLKLKKQLISVKKYVVPQRDIMAQISKGNSSFISEKALLYFRDLYDHMIRIADSIDLWRELISGAMEVSLGVISNKMNEVITVLTIITTILMPLTFITGIYGMNFKRMPGLNWEYSFPVILVLMALVSLLMLRFFKKKGWI
ncbi:magnesium/cobalt transporter CorA [Candidatus Woesearchaeota archaeon]|nr:magnesium/cobalt transporter CorA [Candidatus Woesearchaeota archaeon]